MPDDVTKLWIESSQRPGQPMLDVGDAQPVLERLERIAVGDTARVAVRVQEPEPDRELANEVEIPVRKVAGSDSRCGSGHGNSF